MWGAFQGTLAHLCGAWGFWLAAWQGVERPPPLPSATVDVIRESWEAKSAEVRSFISSLAEADLAAELKGWRVSANYSVTLEENILQSLLHSVQHRAEAAALLSEYGHSPGELDYLFFLRDRGVGETD